MSDAATVGAVTMVALESEDARSAFAAVLKAKRAGPDGSVVRKVMTLVDLDLHGKDTLQGHRGSASGCYRLYQFVQWHNLHT